MKRSILPVIISMLIPLWSHAQFGLTAGRHFNNASDWEIETENGTRPLLEDGYSIGIDYWFRLKNARVEFLPEINYARYERTLDPVAESTVNNLSLFFNANIYFLDFFGDCDCPTFSKREPFFKKGLFLRLSPGISYLDQTLASTVPISSGAGLGVPEIDDEGVAPSIGVGLGFDVGLSDLLTLSPLATIRYYPSTEWEGLNGENVNLAIRSAESGIWQFLIGIRLGFRTDQT